MTAVQSGPTSITVTWIPPDPLDGITGYRISFTGGSHDSVVVSGAKTSSYSLTGLSNGHVYSISVASTTSASFSSLAPVQAATVGLGKYKKWDIYSY